MIFNVLSPVVTTVDADTFASAAKKFVTMQRSLDITKLIMADRFKNAVRADVVYTVKDGEVVAGISLSPTKYPVYPTIQVSTSGQKLPSVGPPFPLINAPIGGPFSVPAVSASTRSGQQVFPVSNVAVGGINASAVGAAFPIMPSLAHQTVLGNPMISPYPGMFFNNKSLKK